MNPGQGRAYTFGGLLRDCNSDLVYIARNNCANKAKLAAWLHTELEGAILERLLESLLHHAGSKELADSPHDNNFGGN